MNEAVGRLHRIWIKRNRRGPMESVETATCVAGRGLLGSADQGGRRQVTVLDLERWNEACARAGRPVDPIARRANLLVSGLDLVRTRGRLLRVGPVTIAIRGETRPCERMEEACPGLQAALDPDWAGGIYGEVLAGGSLHVGDPVFLETSPVTSER